MGVFAYNLLSPQGSDLMRIPLSTIRFLAYSLVGIVAFFVPLTIGGGLGVVLSRNVVHAALSLLVSLIAVAGVYLVLFAEFLALVQVLTRYLVLLIPLSGMEQGLVVEHGHMQLVLLLPIRVELVLFNFRRM